MNTRLTRKWVCLPALATLIALLAAVPAIGASGGVHGRVLALDQDGAFQGVVPGAKIEFKNQALAVVATATCDANGYYRIEDLPPGKYFFKVQAANFKDEDVGRGLELKLNDGLAVYNFNLTAGSTSGTKRPPKLTPVAVGAVEGRVQEKTEDVKLVDIAGATISVRKKDGRPKLTQIVTGEAPDGRSQGYYCAVLEEAPWTIAASATGFERFVDPNELSIKGDKTVTRNFILSRSKPKRPTANQGINGTIAYAEGVKQPSPSHVKVTVIALDQIPLKLVTSTKPDSAGKYACDLETGNYIVAAEAEGFRMARSGPERVFPGKRTIVDLSLLPVVKTPSPEEIAKTVFSTTVFGRTSDDVSGRIPLEGATVRLVKKGTALSSAMTGKTNKQGGADVPIAEPGDYVAQAEMSGYRPEQVELQLGKVGPNPRTTFTLVPESVAGVPTPPVPPSGYSVKIAVYEEGRGKRPLAGAKVLVRKPGAELAEAQRGTTDEQGIVRLSLDDAGDYQAMARLTRFEPGGAELSVKGPGEQLAEVYLHRIPGEPSTPEVQPTRPDRPSAPYRVQLTVVDTSNRALEGAKVDVRLGEDSVATGYSNLRGLFAAGPFQRERYYAVVTKPGYRPNEIDMTKAQGDFADKIVLTPIGGRPEPPIVKPTEPVVRPIGMLEVTVFETVRGPRRVLSRQPVAGARIVVNSASRPRATAVSDARGRAQIELPQGNYEVVVSHPRYFENRTGASLAQKQALSEIELRPVESTGPRPPDQPAETALATLNVQVAGRDARVGMKMLAGAQITVSGGGAQIAPQQADSFGRATFRLAPGEYDVAAGLPGFQSKQERVVLGPRGALHRMVLDAAAGETQPAETATATLHVQAAGRDARGGMKMLAGAQIAVSGGGARIAPQQADSLGRATFRLAPGEYDVAAGLAGFQSKQERVVLGPKGTLHRMILDAAAGETQPSQAVLTVRVERQMAKGGTQPLPGATVSVAATQAGGETKSLKTDDAGQCRVQLRLGEYRIQVAAPAYHPGTATVKLGADAVQSIVLQPSVDIR